MSQSSCICPPVPPKLEGEKQGVLEGLVRMFAERAFQKVMYQNGSALEPPCFDVNDLSKEQRDVLRFVNFEGQDLSGANLVGANLRGTNLYCCNLEGADIKGADLRGAEVLLSSVMEAQNYKDSYYDNSTRFYGEDGWSMSPRDPYLFEVGIGYEENEARLNLSA